MGIVFYDFVLGGGCLWVPLGKSPGDFQIVEAFGF